MVANRKLSTDALVGKRKRMFWVSGRQPFLYQIMEGLPVIWRKISDRFSPASFTESGGPVRHHDQLRSVVSPAAHKENAPVPGDLKRRS